MYAHRRTDLLAVGLLAAAAIGGVLLWPQLPEQMAIHWGAAGSPNTFVPKPVAVFGLPAFGVAVIAFTRVAPDSLTNTPGGEDLAILFVGGVIALVQAAVYAWNLGYESVLGFVIGVVVVGAGLLVAYEYAR